jgi:serine phosphatase RsbU (regulator of sigma subunit)
VLSRDATLVFYTDGITEARGPERRPLGEAGLAAMLARLPRESPEVLAEGVLAEVSAQGEGTLRDDAAVLAVRLA